MSDDDAKNEVKAPKSLAELIEGHTDEFIAKLVSLGVAHFRPALAEIYMAARSAIELAEDTGEAKGGAMLDARGRIIFAMFFGAAQFSSVQAMVGEAHASSVLFFVDGVFRQLREIPGVDRSREGGKMVAGCKLTKALRTATNFLRHRQTWNADGKSDEKAMLEAIGVEENDEAPATKMLKAIGLGSYMDFEDCLANAFVEVVLGKEFEIQRKWRIGGLSAMREKGAETAPAPEAAIQAEPPRA